MTMKKTQATWVVVADGVGVYEGGREECGAVAANLNASRCTSYVEAGRVVDATARVHYRD
jgi:hypothetical protein